MAKTPASGRANHRVASAEPAAVRAAVINVPSITARGAPVSASKTAMRAWWVGCGPPAFFGNTLTSFVTNEAAEGR